MRTRIFIDYWNFQLAWEQRYRGRDRDWSAVPKTLIRLAQDRLGQELGTLTLEETRIYASYDTGHPSAGKFRRWLSVFLDQLPGVRVFQNERRWRRKPVHCRDCHEETVDCPACGKPFGRAAEKAVDARIVTDMLALAWEQAYDVALLVTSDGDFVPAVDKLQAKNFKVINARWNDVGDRLAEACWASFPMDTEIPKLIRRDLS